jgi:serine/threonine protein kinase
MIYVMARLIWRRRDGSAKEFPLAEETILGRDASLQCVMGAKSVSRRHAKVERKDEAFYVTDLGSMNGTHVNGTRITETRRLDPGDRIQVGDEVLEFDMEAPQLTRGSLVTEPLERRPRDPARDSRGGAETFPRRVGKFYLLKRLGQGGMGTVYHAIDLDSNRETAVKFIRSSIGKNDAFLDFFHNREAVLAREIDHPNVIRIHEHGVDASQHYISMEYVTGRNLYHVLKHRHLQPDEVLEIVRQVACGLSAAHRQGVVHSDIKPANILLVGEGEDTECGAPPAATDPGDDAQGILEFDDRTRDAPRQGVRYDPGLIEEIHRRIGEPPREILADPPYFARASEMRFLSHYFERILEGRGYFILIEGEVGTGKDRLISEFLKERKAASELITSTGGAAPIKFHELDCSRIEGLPLLYEQLFPTGVSGKLTLRQIGSEVVRRMAEDPTPKAIRLLNLGDATPVVCDLIVALGNLMRRQGILVVGAVGPEEVRSNASLKPFIERMAPVTKELYLRPLTEYQIQRYLQEMFRDPLTGLSLAADLYRLSGGNFAKLFDILRGFFERGILKLDQPAGRILYRPRAQELELEEGKSLYEKYKTFEKLEQRVLEHAAFIGQRFLFDTLLRLHDINETSLFFIVRTLLAEGFFVEESRNWYGFTNAAFQKYMAERIPASEGPHLHRKISRLLQSVAVPESADLFQLRARHLAGCRDYARAVQALLEGAHLARNEYRVDLCREMFQEILRIYRLLARKEADRKEVTAILREWFHRDGNWYEVLGELGSYVPFARVKLADFGISFRLTDDERGYQVEKRPALGTPRYMAPERGDGEYGGFKSDLFALGIIAYEMATGRAPFPDLKGNDVIAANRERAIELPPEVLERYPPGMAALLAGLLEKDPVRRWDAERVVREVVKLQYDLRLGGVTRSAP